jgi:hypothetical protein
MKFIQNFEKIREISHQVRCQQSRGKSSAAFDECLEATTSSQCSSKPIGNLKFRIEIPLKFGKVGEIKSPKSKELPSLTEFLSANMIGWRID